MHIRRPSVRIGSFSKSIELITGADFLTKEVECKYACFVLEIPFAAIFRTHHSFFIPSGK